MANISPGVYTKIIDLSSYVQAVPSTIGLICALTEKGEDNVLKFLGSRSELISEYGEPNISAFGKNYGQGLYMAYNFLGESGSLYFCRCMPDDAAFANILIQSTLGPLDSTATISVEYIPTVDATTYNELVTALEAAGNNKPLCVLYPIGRGEYYNGLSVRFTEHSNPLLDGVYVMDVYERQSDGTDVIIESFELSFDPFAVDAAGDSLWIKSILDTYSSVLRAVMIRANEEYSSGYQNIVRVYDKSIGAVTVTETSGSASISDNKQNFSDWSSDSTAVVRAYCITAIDPRGSKLYGWLGEADAEGSSVDVFNSRIVAGSTQTWIGDVSNFDASGEVTYIIKKSFSSVASAFSSSEPVPLRKGSDGSLRNLVGDVDSATATQLLSQGYLGTLTSKKDGSTLIEDVLDTEFIYYTVVFDCGYPSEVKTQISTLVQTRRDCVAILDNGDNASFNAAMTKRQNDHTFNTYLCALYESYNKIYDTWTGLDAWFSPVYHMAYLLPRNDNVAEIWWAVAGFNRASIDTIKDLRYSPRIGQRDQMYLKQLNPIVKFNQGYTVWGQLTTQAKPSALQDLNIVRLVLYIKRALEQYCRFFIFELNDETTWGEVSGNIVYFLDSISQKRGLYSYSVDVGATEYERKTKTFHVNVTLEPTRVVEKIELNFFIK